jgi:hypothetical protein
MKRRSKPPPPAVNDAPPTTDAGEVLQIKVWLVGISPMIWRRVLVPAAFSLRELHGVMQVAMGWEGIQLYQFCLRAARYLVEQALLASHAPLFVEDYTGASRCHVGGTLLHVEGFAILDRVALLGCDDCAGNHLVSRDNLDEKMRQSG